MTGKPTSAAGDPAANTSQYRVWLALALATIVLAYGLYVAFGVHRDHGLVDVFALLEERGYTLNPGLAGTYRPGNVIQTVERGPDGEERPLASPLLFLWEEDCFPDQTLRESPLALPETSGTRSASLRLDASVLTRMAPALEAGNTAGAEYKLEIENPKVRTYARADLSGRLSPRCVEDLKQALRDGDEIGWFAVITEAVEADALEFEMRWTSKTSAEVKATLTEAAEKALAGVAGSDRSETPGVKARVAIEADDERRTVLSARGPVVLAFRSRPLQPRYTEPGAETEEEPTP